MRERAFGTRGTATGQQKLAAKDQFNVLLGQALETTSNRSSQEHQRNLGNKPLHNSAETMCPTIPENLAIHGDPDTKTSDSGRPSTRHMTSQVAGVISPDLPTIRSMSVDQLEKYRLRPDQQATEEAKKAVTRRQRLDETTSDDDRHPQFVLTGELAITGAKIDGKVLELSTPVTSHSHVPRLQQLQSAQSGMGQPSNSESSKVDQAPVTVQQRPEKDLRHELDEGKMSVEEKQSIEQGQFTYNKGLVFPSTQSTDSKEKRDVSEGSK
jgi:hypothetical protein